MEIVVVVKLAGPPTISLEKSSQSGQNVKKQKPETTKRGDKVTSDKKSVLEKKRHKHCDWRDYCICSSKEERSKYKGVQARCSLLERKLA
jgi:hypothetical protein